MNTHKLLELVNSKQIQKLIVFIIMKFIVNGFMQTIST